jgi:hypothetical protein
MKVAGIGYIGAATCKIIDSLFYGSTGGFYQNCWGVFATVAFAVCIFIGLFILLPFEVARSRKTVEKVQAYVEAGWIKPEGMSLLDRIQFWAGFGNLPKWVYLPIVILACTLAGITALALIGMVIWFFSS